MKFKSEKQLFETALTCSSFTDSFSSYSQKYLIEPKGLFGIPDLVVVDVDCNRQPQQLFCAAAFEMKLSNWRRAIMQAFRYRAFAEKSFVVLDNAFVRPALRNIEIFQRASIGLISIDYDGNLIRHYEPKEVTPYCESLRGNLENIVFNYSDSYEFCLINYQI
jgi:hypothetical protein